MRRAFFQQCRSFTISTSNLYPRKSGSATKRKSHGSVVGEIVRLAATQSITPQNAVQRITSSAKDKSESARLTICQYLWKHSMNKSWKSKGTTIAITDFLIHLSYQNQEDFDSQPQDLVRSPVTIENDWGRHDRLWHDMPEMWPHIFEICEVSCTQTPTPGVEIDRLLNDVYFLSVLFQSSQPVFDDLSLFIRLVFDRSAGCPARLRYHERWKIWIPATIIQMSTAGAKIKEKVLSNRPDDRHRLTVGLWRQWQGKLSDIAADETIDMELRIAAKQACEMMNIEKHLTNRWWRRWRKELSEIAADPSNYSEDRITAFKISNELSIENAEEEAAAVRMLPLPTSLPLLPPPT